MQMKPLYDDCFYVEESRWKTWSSYDKEGNVLVTSFSEEDCVEATRFYLKRKQEKNYGDCVFYEGVVSGKL